MPVKTGRLAEFRRAIDRLDPSAQLSFDPQQELSASRALPPALADQLKELETDELLEILQGADASLRSNREVRDFVGDLLRHRSDDDFDDELDSGRPDVDLEPEESEEREFFVGWVAGQGGDVELVSHSYRPSNRAEVSHETLERYRNRMLAGGMVGKADSKADLAQAVRLQRANDRFSGRSLTRVGEVEAMTLMHALQAVINPALKNLLQKSGNREVTVALEGRQAVLLTKDGHITPLSRVETRHLALVGILPRHWFLPMMWWKRMADEQEADLAEKGRSKKRIYKGRYEDDDNEGMEGEEKE